MSDKDMERYVLGSKIGVVFEWSKWQSEIPYLPIEKLSAYNLRAIPPFANAIVRYNLTNPKNDNFCSVYLDCYDLLGIYGRPYWEVYPIDNDIFRCDMNDVDSLIGAIIESLDGGR